MSIWVATVPTLMISSISPSEAVESEVDISIGTAEAAAKFFKDPRSHGAPKEYTAQATAVLSRIYCIPFFYEFYCMEVALTNLDFYYVHHKIQNIICNI